MSTAVITFCYIGSRETSHCPKYILILSYLYFQRTHLLEVTGFLSVELGVTAHRYVAFHLTLTCIMYMKHNRIIFLTFECGPCAQSLLWTLICACSSKGNVYFHQLRRNSAEKTLHLYFINYHKNEQWNRLSPPFELNKRFKFDEFVINFFITFITITTNSSWIKV